MFTLKQQKFIEFYEGNATEAAIKAGFSKKTAYSSGQRLLKDVEIAEAIKKRQEKEQKSTIASRQERAEFYSKIVRDDSEETPNRIKAAETLGKMEGDFIERHEHKGNISISYKFTPVKNAD